MTNKTALTFLSMFHRFDGPDSSSAQEDEQFRKFVEPSLIPDSSPGAYALKYARFN